MMVMKWETEPLYRDLEFDACGREAVVHFKCLLGVNKSRWW